MCARLARNVRAQPPPGHGRGGPIPVPPARAACKPRDRGAEKRGSSCHNRSVGWSYSDEPAQFVCVPGARNARCRNLARRSACNLCSYAFLHDFEQNRSIHFRCMIKPS
jgi:hypothetical protein